MHEAIPRGPHAGGSTGRTRNFSRFADIVIASGLIVLFLPVMAFVAVAAYRSRSPLILRRPCTTAAGRQTIVYEFNDSTDQGSVFARDTRARGRPLHPFVRAFRGDQLPQLFNVLRGELSFFCDRSRPPPFVD